MANVILQNSSVGANMHDKGGGLPTWNGHESDPKYWYNDGVPSSGNTNGFYNLVHNSETNTHQFIQYGQDTQGWAGVIFIDDSVNISSQKLNPDGSVDVVGSMGVGSVDAFRTNHFTKGVSVILTITVQGNQVLRHQGLTGDKWSQLPNPHDFNFSVNIPPQTSSHVMTMNLKWEYPNHEYPTYQFAVGTDIYNPNQGLYTPMMVKSLNGQWIKLNDQNKNIQIKQTNWAIVPKEQLATQNAVNTGHSRTKRGANYQQMPLP